LLLGVQAEVENVEGTWQEITSVFSGIVWFFATDFQLQRQHHGHEFDVPSQSFRPDLCCRDGWRFHSIHHGRSEWRDGLAEDQNQSNGVQLARVYREEHFGSTAGRKREQE
jgi:hypothetical protein